MSMDIIAAARGYIDRIVSHKALRKDSNVGKVLILDAYTTQVVANVSVPLPQVPESLPPLLGRRAAQRHAAPG